MTFQLPLNVELKVPLGHGTADYGRRSGGEAQLEHEGRADGTEQLVVDRRVDKVATDADYRVRRLRQAETHAKTEDPVGHTAQDYVHDVLHHYVDLVLKRYASRLQHSETCVM